MLLDYWGERVETAIQDITHLLVNTSENFVYFDGWRGLGASVLLKTIAKHPPSSLREKFSKIIHIDCWRWKNRRALQRAIVKELELPRWVKDAFDRRDEEDDFSGRNESSRAEIGEISGVILRYLMQYKCLVIFHNGSGDMVDLVACGIPPPEFFGTKVLWTYRGRLHLDPKLMEKVPSSHIRVRHRFYDHIWSYIVAEEAREIALYTHKLGVTPEVAKECCMYLLSLNHQGGNIMDYNWAIHASNYWVCDGILGGGHDDQAWEIARALHHEIWLEDYSSNTLPDFGHRLHTPWNRWMFITNSNMEKKPHPETTSLFLAFKSGFERPLTPLPNGMFHQVDQLHVLKLCCCSFSYQSPPFHCCHSLRFLGLESCMDQQQERVDEKDSRAVEIFQRLWVLDVCYTDWELAFPLESEEEMATKIREVHIKKGKIWHNNLAWRKLRNLRKLCIVEPTGSWETGKKDEFKDMVNLELLELSRNSSIQVLPSMSDATGLKTLILDGCVGLEHIGPGGLPPSLESFSFDAGLESKDPARLSKISLAGCARLQSFLLHGALPGLEELNLSGTSVRKVDLTYRVVQAQRLKRVFLIGCTQLRALLWMQAGLQLLEVLRIDTHGRNEQTPPPSSSLCSQQKNHDGYVIASDARIIQSLLYDSSKLITNSLYLHLYVDPSTSRSERQSTRGDKQQGIHKPCCYSDDVLEGAYLSYDDGKITWPPPSDRHVEVSEGIDLSEINAISRMMWGQFQSLHVHDNSCISAVNPKPEPGGLQLPVAISQWELRWCRVERCSKLQAVFMSSNAGILYGFRRMEAIWASHLPMASYIWGKVFLYKGEFNNFVLLRSIHIHDCPRLEFVLPFSITITLPSLETLTIARCGDLRQVFPWDDDDASVPLRLRISRRQEVKYFPKLKRVHLHDLPSLQEICEGRMLTPKLESIELRGCWALRRLPAAGRKRTSPAVVHCEKDCWEKLEWDGLNVGHHPSLYELRQSSKYYRKRLLRGTVLR